MKIFLTTTAPEGQFRENKELLTQLSQTLESFPFQKYDVVDLPASADIILYIEPNYWKTKKYVRTLLAQPNIRSFPNKCFGHYYDDGPLGFLPGSYTGLSLDGFDPNRFRSGGYIGTQYNELITFAAERIDQPTSILASFRGSASSPLRQALFASDLSKRGIPITQTFSWFNHSEDEKQNYVQDILDSKFVLCPRGIAPVSIRLFEVMQLGRVPVILSDSWVEPEGPSWPEFSLRISETKLHELPDILRSQTRDAAEMGRLARQAWEKWFAPEVHIGRVVQRCESIMLRRPTDHDERKYHEEWQSFGTAIKNRWTVPQRAYDFVKSGRAKTALQKRIKK